MKNQLIAALAFSGLLAAPACAADLAARPYAKAPAIEAVYSWTGFYVGGTLGYSWNHLNVNDLDYWDGLGDSSLNSNGAAAGVTVGYNWQYRHLVYGVEGDISWLSNSRTSNNDRQYLTGIPFAQINSKIDALATIRGRIGVEIDPALVYFTGGVAFGHVHNSYVDVANVNTNLYCPGCTTWSDSDWRTGFTFGGGLESMLGANWSVKLETLYYQLGDHTVEVTPYKTSTSAYRQRFDDSGIIARVGVNYRFGGAPVVAKY